MQESEAYCERCDRHRLVRRESVTFWEYIGASTLTVFSCGILGLIFIPLLIARECGMGRPWLCTRCGKKC